MAEPFLGEIKIVGFNFAPKGWATCDGQLLAIAQNTALFSLLGTTYGGNGQTTFALPDLRGRVPIHEGAGRVLGEKAGTESHTLLVGEIPAHGHALQATSAAATTDEPASMLLAKTDLPLYGAGPANVAMSPSSLSPAGGSQPHQNVQPYLVVNIVIALQGIFPSRP